MRKQAMQVGLRNKPTTSAQMRQSARCNTAVASMNPRSSSISPTTLKT
jgi:hypothetical protein